MSFLEQVLGKRWTHVLLFVGIFVVFFTKSDHYYGWTSTSFKDKEHPVISDGTGYYAYMPAWFIYHTAKYDFSHEIIQRYPYANFPFRTSTYNKFYTGTAVCLTPFFGIGHIHASLAGEIQDGYSWPYLLWVTIGICFYATLALVGLFCFLRKLKLSYFSIFFTVIGIAFATNYCFYSYLEIPYSHIFSFAVVSWTLYFFICWNESKKSKYLLFIAFLLGLGLIIRPTNGLLILFFPFILGSWSGFVAFIRELVVRWKRLLVLLLVFLIPILIQYYSSYCQHGEWIFNGYENEGFTNWKTPYLWSILFGFRKGFFIYGPFLLLMIPGLFVLFFKARYLFWGTFVFFLVSMYVISSWWCWWYGGSLGLRSGIDFMPIYVIPLAFLIHYSSTLLRVFFLVFIALSIFVYQRYEYQYKRKIIHYDYMNYPMFRDVFLKTDDRYRFIYFSKRDTMSVEAKAVGVPFDLKLVGKETDEFKYLVSNQVIKPGVFHDSIGIKVSVEVYLLHQGAFPSITTVYYKDGKTIKQRDAFIGSLPTRIKHWEKWDIDVVPELTWSEVDSIQTKVLYYDRDARFRYTKAQFYSY